LGVLVAEAWYRARDFPNAAAAYAAVLDAVPDGIAAGDLMFQRVMADIEAGRLEVAEAQLDAFTADPRFAVVSRWQTEWNLARALQVAGRTEAAFARVNRLLAAAPGESAALPAELQARMRWLQARLSLEAGQPEQTLDLVAALPDTVTGIPDELRRQVMSSSVLLQAEALFRLDRREEAVTLLQKLREDYPGSDAAIYSFVIEAEYHAQLGQTVEAQRLYTKLADDFPGDERYASYALYQAALQAERRGQDSNFIEANRLIEDLVRKYPASPLVFYARLKQGDLLRKLNQFPQAQQVYETLVNNHTDHADVVLAQLALAECHNAQSLNDTNHAERAISLFENLRDRVDAPVEVRVEAGFNLGYLLLRTERRDRAEAIWWRDVVTAFLLDERMAGQLGAKGRYWMTRTLLELGAIYEQQARFEQAQEAWSLILRSGLPGRALARDRLARYTLPANQP
jgi:tetratricopeptide (TPR) repeat protein